MQRWAIAFAVALPYLALCTPCLAQHHQPSPPATQHAPNQHGPAQHAPAAPETSHEAKGGPHADANAPPKPINWYYGFLGKKDGVEPSLLWRRPDQDAPYLAALINFAVFAWILYRFGRKPLQEALVKRKESILRDIEAAQKMLVEAEKRLKHYEDKLAHIDNEVDRIRQEFREQGERDKERIIQDAEEKRERMLKDARFLIEQESKQMRVVLLRETVDAAVRAAEEVLQAKITTADHDRLAEEFLKQVAASRGTTPTKGGRA